MSTSTITTKDSTTIYYKAWGTGQPGVFSHGWPLNADAWDDQLVFVASHGYRAIAHDRRGGGRSSQPWDGNDMDHYADDLAALIDTLDLKDAVLVGHSTGGGAVTRYTDPDHPRRRRPDRADRRLGPALLQARQRCNPEDLSGRAPWPDLHAPGAVQRRPAVLPEVLEVVTAKGH